ncbi:MAG: hypothetical protein IKU84_06400, partial [Clostridia bacterium]|nr:hypothetical protein [Clostridia bacterium]
MDPYDLPEEFSHLQAQDMTKLGFMQDLIRGIKKIIQVDEPAPTVVRETVVTQQSASTAPLLKRAFMFLEDGNWDSATEYCEKVLDSDPECAEAYLGELMAELKVRKRSDLRNALMPFDNKDNYKKAMRFGDDALKAELTEAIMFIRIRNETQRLERIYTNAVNTMSQANTDIEFRKARDLFNQIPQYKDAAKLAEDCEEKALDCFYVLAVRSFNSARSVDQLNSTAFLFDKISNYKDSANIAATCRERANELILEKAKEHMAKNTLTDFTSALDLLAKIPGFKNADALIAECEEAKERIKAEKEARIEEQKRQLDMIRVQKANEKMRKERNSVIFAIIAAVLSLIFLIWLFL